MKRLTSSSLIVSALAVSFAIIVLSLIYSSEPSTVAPEVTGENSNVSVVNETPTGPTPTIPTRAEKNTYTNPVTGYTALLPESWTATETKVSEGICEEGTVNITMFTDGNLTMSIGARLVGSDVHIQCRTGVPAGELIDGPPIIVGDDEFTPQYQEYLGNTGIVWLGQAEILPITTGQYELVISIESTDSSDYGNFDVPSQVDYPEVLDILDSLELS